MASLAAACTPGPIVWSDSVGAFPDFDHALAGPIAGGPVKHVRLEREKAPAIAGVCRDSAAVFWDEFGKGTTYVAWWRPRTDSSAELVAATSLDRKVWSTPVVLDSADVGRVGCARPVPGIWIDGDNVHVVYAMKAREGPGVFLSHSMDRGRTFHSPVAVVYGERPGRASVASNGNVVVVAFEDPNTTPTRVSVAVSNTMAHLFEFREVISPRDVAAYDPIVLVFGKRVLIGWRRAGDSTRTGVEGILR